MIVVKIGGASGVDFEHICKDIAQLVSEGKKVIVVHGGSAETNEISTQLGFPPRFLTSVSGYTSRYTDRTTLEIFAMVTAGKINSLLVEKLQKMGVNAFGLSGIDGRLMVAKRKTALRVIENGKQKIIRDDYTGKIEEVNADLLFSLIENGLVPVIAPIAISYESDILNTDADRAAAMVAAAVKAETLVLLTNVPGLLRKFPDENTLIKKIDKKTLESYMDLAEGRMKKKVLGAQESLDLGVQSVIFADGRVKNPLSNALQGNGTLIC